MTNKSQKSDQTPKPLTPKITNGDTSVFPPDMVLFDQIGKSVIVLDYADNNRVAAASLASADLLDIPVQQMLGRPSVDLFSTPLVALIASSADVPGKPCMLLKTVMPSADFPDRTIEWSLHNITTSSRRYGMLIGRDITQQARTEKRLHKLSRAVEQSPISVIITDVRGIIEYVNPRFTQLTGYGYDEAIGKTPAILKSGFTAPQQYQELWETIAAGQEWRGELLNRKKSGELFWERISISPLRNEKLEISHYVAVKEDITVRKEYEKRLFYQARYDELTKLPNRIQLMDRLTLALLKPELPGSHIGVAYIDLDDFKKVNDTLGHSYGDDLLRLAARRLLGCIRPCDTVGRLGGDEFLLILPELRDQNQADSIVKNILREFTLPFTVSGHSITTTASIGLTLSPEDGTEAEILLRNADTAMYRAKDAGRNCVRVFLPELNDLAIKRLRMESLLRRAIDHHELSVAYQPQIEISTGRLVGAEALARWHSPELGTVPPMDFIMLAEDCGLIESIGNFVLETACRQVEQWQKDLPPTFHISINVSPRQMALPDFPTTIERKLNRIGLPLHRLELELTEGLFALKNSIILENLKKLRAMGVRLAVDDFGTGYSALSYLREFPVDTVKIDRSFISPVGELAADALVCAIVAMGHSLGLDVVAEGVETEDQIQFLSTITCDMAQGYHIARPMPPNAFLHFAHTLETRKHSA